MRLSYVAGAMLLTLPAVLIGVAKWPRAAPKQLGPQLKTAEVRCTSLDVTLCVPGELVAAETESVYCEANQTQIVWVVSDGTWVKPGDTVIKLNDAPLQKAVDDLKSQGVQADERDRSELENAEKRVQNTETAIKKAKDDLALAQVQKKAAAEKAAAEINFKQKGLELEQSRLAKYRRLLAEKLVSMNDVEQATEQVERQQHDLDKARRDLITAQKDSDANEKVKQMDIHKAELELEVAKWILAQTKVAQLRSQMDRARKLADAMKQLEGAQIRVRNSGLLILGQTYQDNMSRTYRVGDTVHEGWRLATVVTPEKIQVRCDINESDIELVKPGQKAHIIVPAIGGDVLPGTVKNIDNLARDRNPWERGAGKRTFTATIVIDKKEPRLRPGMGNTVELILDRAEKCTVVPLEAVFTKDKQTMVYCQQPGGYCEVPVEVSQRSDLLAAVKGKLQAGAKVACERPPVSLLAKAAKH